MDACLFINHNTVDLEGPGPNQDKRTCTTHSDETTIVIRNQFEKELTSLQISYFSNKKILEVARYT